MIGLIRKDIYYLLTNWKPLLLSAIIIGGFATYKGFGLLLIIVFPLFAGCSVMGCVQNDAQKKWYDLNKVLPISLTNVVASRYLSFLVFVILGLVAMLLYGIGIVSTMGLEALGKNFEFWQGFVMGFAIALFFASAFLPSTYYFRGEKMEICMIVSTFVMTAIVTIGSKLLDFINIPIKENISMFVVSLCIISIILFIISWITSTMIYQRQAKA